MKPVSRVGKNGPTADRLRELGVRDTSRALSLLSDLLRRLPQEHAGWDRICRAAAPAPDPDLFLLNLSRWVDSLPGEFLTRAFAREDLLPLIGALLGGSEFIPEQVARRPENKGKQIVVIIPSNAERYLSTWLFEDQATGGTNA